MAEHSDEHSDVHRGVRPRPSVTAILVTAVAVGLLIVGTTQALAWVVGEPVSTLTRDFQVTADVPWYTGSVAVLTHMLWAVAAALALVAAWLQPAERRRLSLLGGFALVLAADDALLLHDAVGPRNGVPQEAFLAGYALVALALLAAFQKPPRSGSALAFLLGSALLGVSAVVDQLFHGLHVLEDGAKLLGVVVWITVPLLALRSLAARTATER